jgi:hypothetical protein
MSLHYQNYTFKNFLGISARLLYPLRVGRGRKEEHGRTLRRNCDKTKSLDY